MPIVNVDVVNSMTLWVVARELLEDSGISSIVGVARELPEDSDISSKDFGASDDVSLINLHDNIM